MELKTRKVNKEEVEFPKRIEITAESKEEEEILQFIVKLSGKNGLVPTMDKVKEMIKEGFLKQDGMEWKFNMHKIMMETTPDMMFG